LLYDDWLIKIDDKHIMEYYKQEQQYKGEV